VVLGVMGRFRHGEYCNGWQYKDIETVQAKITGERPIASKH
jgi:hypothetical protein